MYTKEQRLPHSERIKLTRNVYNCAFKMYWDIRTHYKEAEMK